MRLDVSRYIAVANISRTVSRNFSTNVSTNVSTDVSTNVSTDVAKTYVMTSTRTNDAGLETPRLMAVWCDGKHYMLACIVCGVLRNKVNCVYILVGENVTCYEYLRGDNDDGRL